MTQITKEGERTMKRKFIYVLTALLVLSLVSLVTAGPAVSGDIKKLGRLLFEDLNLSSESNQGCISCHHPTAGFEDPINRISPMYRPVSEGSIMGKFGSRNAPSAAYAGYNPVFYYDICLGLFMGGTFWDGSATGRLDVTATSGLGSGPTGDPLADQAKGPFLNPVEMALGTEQELVDKVEASAYASLFENVFGPNAFLNPLTAYNNIALAIAAFERSNTVNRFKSKFDKFLNEQGGDLSAFGVNGLGDYDQNWQQGFTSKIYSIEEAEGLALFNAADKGKCALCHLTSNHDAKTPPVFSDFTYDNLGIPENPRIAELAGPQMIDYGLGEMVAQLEAAYCGALATSDVCDGLGQGGTKTVVTDEAGKFKVMSLRNIAMTAPYGHNGFFPTLYSIVHFYNTRDAVWPGEPAWPGPEVNSNINFAELGDLGLTFDQEQKIVLFLETLTD